VCICGGAARLINKTNEKWRFFHLRGRTEKRYRAVQPLRKILDSAAYAFFTGGVLSRRGFRGV
jgi:hypothetical protein